MVFFRCFCEDAEGRGALLALEQRRKLRRMKDLMAKIGTANHGCGLEIWREGPGSWHEFELLW
jgi:hypothetical protein